MEKQTAFLKFAPSPLADALRLVLALTPKTEGQIAAQREMVSALENAWDARRHRIILSGPSVNWISFEVAIAERV
jgi:hypothetical protein